MVNVLALSAFNREFEPRPGQIKDCQIGHCYFLSKHTTLRRKNKDCLFQNQDVYKVDLVIISLKIILFSP
jgi:hypothetical protein